MYISDSNFCKCQQYELKSWESCPTSYDLDLSGEVRKQDYYATVMKLHFDSDGKIDANKKSILDIGGGPCSLLLRTKNFEKGTVIDPLNYPIKVLNRYDSASINYIQDKSENVTSHFNAFKFDECWMYNVLEHTQYPEQILESISNVAKVFRIFEWVDFKPYEGHLQYITEDLIVNSIKYKKKDIQIAKFNIPNLLVGKYLAGIFYL